MNRAFHQSRPPDSGQTMIFMILALIILSFVVIWNFDLHSILHLKARTQNAGDAAALAAARWQGITLNLIGDLNVMQAVALTAGTVEDSQQISDLQARLCFVGPIIGLRAAQQAAKNNGLYVHEAFTARLADHSQAVRNDYSAIFPEPFVNCWPEYADMLGNVAAEGLTAAPDNTRLYTDYTGGHVLLWQSFYDAVAGYDWCWFARNDQMDLLENLAANPPWPNLPPEIPVPHPVNSEIFGLGLAPLATTLPGGTDQVARLNQLEIERGLGTTLIPTNVAQSNAVWYVYNQGSWSNWATMRDWAFPVLPNTLKSHYDCAGADAVIRIEATNQPATPGAVARTVTWTAAAKPFGYLSVDDAAATVPNAYDLVLPAFHNVRLIPVDAASGAGGGAYDLIWRDHIDNHLEIYIQSGSEGLDPSCWYCQQLISWEQTTFRPDGVAWLAATNDVGELLHPCFVGQGFGPGPGGGTRRGH